MTYFEPDFLKCFKVFFERLPGNCDFEKGLCTWTNPGGVDDFDWVLGRGSTASQLTGPSADHTVGNATGNHKIY